MNCSSCLSKSHALSIGRLLIGVRSVVGTVVFMALIFFHAKWEFVAPWLLTPAIVYGLDLALRSIRFRVKEATLKAVDDQITLVRSGTPIHLRWLTEPPIDPYPELWFRLACWPACSRPIGIPWRRIKRITLVLDYKRAADS
jgi:hypothetical protein